ncbi:unnamed protein product, partial [Prorocentrum cordatum]
MRCVTNDGYVGWVDEGTVLLVAEPTKLMGGGPRPPQRPPLPPPLARPPAWPPPKELDKDALVATIKAYCTKGKEQKERWRKHCRAQNYLQDDPSMKPVEFLRVFWDIAKEHGARGPAPGPPPFAAPPPPTASHGAPERPPRPSGAAPVQWRSTPGLRP